MLAVNVCLDSVPMGRVRLDAVVASTAYQRRRAAVQDHVAAMRSRGLVFDVEFPERSLGLRVALAKYGESGRRFVVVDSTERGSACFESVKPGDELCAVNGAAVVDPDEESIETLKSAIANAPRPLVITFIEGEDRDTLFAAQEAQRGTAARPRKAPPATKKRADIYSAPRDAQLVIVDRDAQYRGHICEDGTTLKDAKGARLLVVDAALGVATDDGGVLVGKVSVNETDAALVGIEDARGRLLGYADQGRSSVLDANKSTILEIDSAGECRGHDGLHVGSLVGFTYHHTKLVAFVFLLRPHLFRDKPKSFLRAMRKSASRASGAHGFFAKAA